MNHSRMQRVNGFMFTRRGRCTTLSCTTGGTGYGAEDWKYESGGTWDCCATGS